MSTNLSRTTPPLQYKIKIIITQVKTNVRWVRWFTVTYRGVIVLDFLPINTPLDYVYKMGVTWAKKHVQDQIDCYNDGKGI